MQEVKIYTTPVCPYCMKAKQLLGELGVKYEEIDVAENTVERERIIEEYNWRTVPAIFIGGELVGGYDDIAKLHAEGKLMSKIEGQVNVK